MAHIEVYLTPWCPYCRAAVGLLESKGQSFEAIDLGAEPGRRPEMEQRAGRRTVPQIFIDGRHVGGYDELSALERAGELDPLLAS